MSRSAKRLIWSSIISLGVTLPALADTPTPISSDALDNLPGLWQRVMTHFYGAYDTKKRCWIGQTSINDVPARFCMRPHKLETVTVDGRRRGYFVTGGYQLTPTGERENCHACSGTMGMIVLEDAGSTLEVRAQNSLFEAYGSWGQIPGEDAFHLEQIGGQNQYGWLVRSGWTGQGISQAWISYYAARGGNIRNIGNIPLSFDENGNCEDGKHLGTGRACTDYSFSQQLDTSDTQAQFYSINLHLTGTREGQPLDQTYRVRFDSKSGHYKLPADLPSDG